MDKELGKERAEMQEVEVMAPMSVIQYRRTGNEMEQDSRASEGCLGERVREKTNKFVKEWKLNMTVLVNIRDK